MKRALTAVFLPTRSSTCVVHLLLIPGSCSLANERCRSPSCGLYEGLMVSLPARTNTHLGFGPSSECLGRAPNYHRIHHRRSTGPGTWNLGFALTVWDQIFGRAVFPTEDNDRARAAGGSPGPAGIRTVDGRSHLSVFARQDGAPFRPAQRTDLRRASRGSARPKGAFQASRAFRRGRSRCMPRCRPMTTSAPAVPTHPSRVRALLAALLSPRTAPLPAPTVRSLPRIALAWIFIYHGGAKRLFGWFGGPGIDKNRRRSSRHSLPPSGKVLRGPRVAFIGVRRGHRHSPSGCSPRLAERGDLRRHDDGESSRSRGRRRDLTRRAGEGGV